MDPVRVSREYDAGTSFNNGIDLYECVKTNENFFIGKQWEGVKANGLPTPVFNFLKRVVLFSVANVSTDNLKLHATPLPSSGENDASALETLTDIINDQFRSLFEFNKIGSVIREFCRNAAVDGDGCTYTYWDSEAETVQGMKGAIRTEILQNTQVLFGNPNCRDVQSQPYIIIERRMMLKEAKKRAREYGGEPESIQTDNLQHGNTQIDSLGGEKVTVLLRLWKDENSGTIHGYECTRNAEIRQEWDLGVTLYPITWMPWDYVQDCYHGQAMITGLIPNQIFVNKLYAMCMISLMTLAYPKVVYDKTRVSGWTNRVGAAIGVQGNVDGVAKIIDPASVSPQIAQFIQLAVSDTQKFLGASDVALGDTRPDNTSAIIALQRAAATPMELTKQDLLQSIEDLGRIYMQFMAEYYGTRYVQIETPFGQAMIPFDFSTLQKVHFSVNLDVGASSYWSEIAAMQTLDNLLMQGKISTLEYVKRVPAGQITDREALIKVLEESEAAAAGAPPGVLKEGPAGAAQEPDVDAVPIQPGGGYGVLQRKLNEAGGMQ